MAKKVLEDAVTRADDDSWTFQCPGVAGSVCGDPYTSQTFTSSGWPTKAIAQARGQQHFDDHKLGQAVREAVEAARADTDDPESVDVAAVTAKAIEESEYNRTPDLDEFRAEHGLQSHSDGVRAVQIGDLT